MLCSFYNRIQLIVGIEVKIVMRCGILNDLSAKGTKFLVGSLFRRQDLVSSYFSGFFCFTE